AVGELRRLRPPAVREAVPRPGRALPLRPEPPERQDALRRVAGAAERGRAAAGDGTTGAETRRDAPPRPRRRLEHRRRSLGDAEEDAGVKESPRTAVSSSHPLRGAMGPRPLRGPLAF